MDGNVNELLDQAEAEVQAAAAGHAMPLAANQDRIRTLCGLLQKVQMSSLAEANMSTARTAAARLIRNIRGLLSANPPSMEALINFTLQTQLVNCLSAMHDHLVPARKVASPMDVNSTMDCLGEVYYIVEDLSETASGKAACGKVFVSRLSRLAMGGDDAHLSMKVRRALLDCLCALISLSPYNQSLLLQEPGCLDLFNRQLAECGDFTMQGTLAEMLFRLSRRAPQLTAQLSNSQVVKFLKSVHGKKQHDLVAEIRQLVNIVNKANAPYRSVHSFVLKSLRIGGADVTSRDERWIDFGYGGLSCYVSSNTTEARLLDIQYRDLQSVKRLSDEILAIQPTEYVVNRIAQELQMEHQGQWTLAVHLKCSDLDFFEACTLPKVKVWCKEKASIGITTSGDLTLKQKKPTALPKLIRQQGPERSGATTGAVAADRLQPLKQHPSQSHEQPKCVNTPESRAFPRTPHSPTSPQLCCHSPKELQYSSEEPVHRRQPRRGSAAGLSSHVSPFKKDMRSHTEAVGGLSSRRHTYRKQLVKKSRGTLQLLLRGYARTQSGVVHLEILGSKKELHLHLKKLRHETRPCSHL